MIEVGIPVFNALDTLPQALDSLVAQTKKEFIVCVCIDGDENNYDEILDEYRRRGLKIRKIESKENCGAGPTRQKIIDTTQCDFITFLDADDMFMPRAIELLSTEIRVGCYDFILSSFIKEFPGQPAMLLTLDNNIITWMHGKIYRVSFLKEKNIRFRDDFRTDEDAFFNSLVWNLADKKGVINEPTYIWKNNKQSVTRSKTMEEFFKTTKLIYIITQIESLKFLLTYKTEDEIRDWITNTMLNIYYYYMRAKFYKCDLTEVEENLIALRQHEKIQKWINSDVVWHDVITKLKPAEFYDDRNVIFFFDENFFNWCNRLIREGSTYEIK